MRMSLNQLLTHRTLSPAEPLVLAGASELRRAVRWVHSSEVLDIAHLLRGGELLLTGGTTLTRTAPDVQRSYVRNLARRAVAGLAVETGPELPSVPPAVVEEAVSQGFPVIELRKVVPFVDVAEVINASLVNDSVARFRSVGELSHRLSTILSEGGEVQELLQELVRTTSVTAAVLDRSGGLVAAAPARPGDPVAERPSPQDVSSRITVRGVHVATLTQYPDPAAKGTTDADPEMLELAQARAAEALHLALARTRSPSPREFAAGELVRLSAGSSAQPERARRLARAVGFDPEAPVIGVAAESERGTAGPARLDDVLQRYGHTAVDAPSPLGVHALISFRERDPRLAARARTALIAELRSWADAPLMSTAVGPAMPDLTGAATSLGAATDCLRSDSGAPAEPVADTTELSVERLLLHDDVRARTERLISEQLGMLLSLRAQEREPLLRTLETYFDVGCNKTRTASLLHLQRQSLYARLERAFGLLGGDPTGTRRALPLHLALRLHLEAS